MALLSDSLCNSECPQDGLPESYFDTCDKFTRKFGHSFFVLVDCTYQFEDITDLEEWRAAYRCGKVIVSPPGILTPLEPEANSFKVRGCGRKAIGLIKYKLSYETYQSDCNNKDWDWFKSLRKNSRQYRLMWFDCYCNWSLTDEWVKAIKSGENTVENSSPGFEFSLTKIPHQIEGEEELAKWVTEFEVERSEMICVTQIPNICKNIIDPTDIADPDFDLLCEKNDCEYCADIQNGARTGITVEPSAASCDANVSIPIEAFATESCNEELPQDIETIPAGIVLPAQESCVTVQTFSTNWQLLEITTKQHRTGDACGDGLNKTLDLSSTTAYNGSNWPTIEGELRTLFDLAFPDSEYTIDFDENGFEPIITICFLNKHMCDGWVSFDPATNYIEWEEFGGGSPGVHTATPVIQLVDDSSRYPSAEEPNMPSEFVFSTACGELTATLNNDISEFYDLAGAEYNCIGLASSVDLDVTGQCATCCDSKLTITPIACECDATYVAEVISGDGYIEDTEELVRRIVGYGPIEIRVTLYCGGKSISKTCSLDLTGCCDPFEAGAAEGFKACR